METKQHHTGESDAFTDDQAISLFQRVPDLEMVKLRRVVSQQTSSSPKAIDRPSQLLQYLLENEPVRLLQSVDLANHEAFIAANAGLFAFDTGYAASPESDTFQQRDRFLSVHAFFEKEEEKLRRDEMRRRRDRRYEETDQYFQRHGTGSVPLDQLTAVAAAMLELSSIAAYALQPLASPNKEHIELGLPDVSIHRGSTSLSFGGGSALITGTGIILATACSAFGLAGHAGLGFGLGAGLTSLGVIEMALGFRKTYLEGSASRAATEKTRLEIEEIRARLERLAARTENSPSEASPPPSSMLPEKVLHFVAQKFAVTPIAVAHLCNRGLLKALAVRARLGKLRVSSGKQITCDFENVVEEIEDLQKP